MGCGLPYNYYSTLLQILLLFDLHLFYDVLKNSRMSLGGVNRTSIRCFDPAYEPKHMYPFFGVPFIYRASDREISDVDS